MSIQLWRKWQRVHNFMISWKCLIFTNSAPSLSMGEYFLFQHEHAYHRLSPAIQPFPTTAFHNLRGVARCWQSKVGNDPIFSWALSTSGHVASMLEAQRLPQVTGRVRTALMSMNMHAVHTRVSPGHQVVSTRAIHGSIMVRGESIVIPMMAWCQSQGSWHLQYTNMWLHGHWYAPDFEIHLSVWFAYGTFYDAKITGSGLLVGINVI